MRGWVFGEKEHSTRGYVKTGTVLRLSVQDGKLKLKHPSDLVFSLVPTGLDRFRSVEGPVDIDLVFEEPAGGEPTLLRLCIEDRKPVTFHAVERICLDRDELGEYAGEYTSEELEVTYRFLLREDRFALKLGYDPEQPPLEPTVRDGFSVKDRNLQFVRDGQGRISGFHARAGRVKNVWFARTGPG